MKRMACNSFRWKAANQSKDWRIRRRTYIYIYIFRTKIQQKNDQSLLFTGIWYCQICMNSWYWSPNSKLSHSLKAVILSHHCENITSER
jgi:hypothetical protein